VRTQIGVMELHISATWRIRLKPSVFGGDAALCQITLTTCFATCTKIIGQYVRKLAFANSFLGRGACMKSVARKSSGERAQPVRARASKTLPVLKSLTLPRDVCLIFSVEGDRL